MGAALEALSVQVPWPGRVMLFSKRRDLQCMYIDSRCAAERAYQATQAAMLTLAGWLPGSA